MAFTITKEYYARVLNISELIPDKDAESLFNYVGALYRSDLQGKYSEPMLWIGVYIALASLLCILAMAADLLHGLQNKMFWIPSKYFSINATSLLVISVAMKLPVDLSGAMPGDVDQVAKLGSMAFMCTMMANLLPSIAAMNSKELLTNITAMGIMVITLVVNICIQIKTGVVSTNLLAHAINFIRSDLLEGEVIKDRYRNSIIATTYVIILLVLLIIQVSSSLAILRSKQIIESKYQSQSQHHEKDSKQSSGELFSVDKLQHLLRDYWIMAISGSPQFIATCSVTTAASGVISVVPAALHTLTMYLTIQAMLHNDYDSDYKWSMLLILIVQYIGVMVGTIAPFLRCFAALNFKVSIKSITNHINVFKVESYWISKLSEWKLGSMPFPFRGNKLEAVIHYSRNIIISFCILLQKGVVRMCKTIALIAFFIVICVLYCFRCLKKLLKPMFQLFVKRTPKSKQNEDLHLYVLQLEDEKELAELTLDGLLKSMNRLLKKGEKQHPKNLMMLIHEKSKSGFPGVKDFDNQSLPSQKYQDCWSLALVTLTAIVVSLPGIEKEQVDSLLKSVREGLKYVTLIEESLNDTDDYASVRRAAEKLWPEVNFHQKWLGIKLQNVGSSSNQGDKTRHVIEWLKDTSEKRVTAEVESTDMGDLSDDSARKSICADSMYWTTQTILLSYKANIDDKTSHEKVINPKQLFDELSSMIADIMAACLTNLPQVIAMKCHTSEIEKREASVRFAAALLGQTKQIINTVQARHPNLDIMDQHDLPFLEKWRSHASLLV